MNNSKKGQAAMEYLMTYGWAILVIVIVLAVLVFYLPRLVRPPEMCLFESPGFSCNDPPAVIVTDANTNEVRVLFVLRNEQGRTINVTGVLCTTAAAGDIEKSMAQSVGAVRLAAGATENFEVDCLDASGDPLVLGPNSDFRGSLAIVYNHVPEVPGAPSRLAKAGLTGTVVSE